MLTPQQINYQLFGESGPVLVLIHGLDSAWPTFENILPFFSDYQLLVYDQRGHGKTEPVGENYRSRPLAGDLLTLLDHLHIKQAHILGHSMGARTATRFAADYPERTLSLIIEDMELHKRRRLTAAQQKQLLLRYRLMREHYKQRTYTNRQQLVERLSADYTSAQIDYLLDRRAAKNADGSWQLLFRPEVGLLYGNQGNAENLLPYLKNVQCPTLAMQASSKDRALTDKGLRLMRNVNDTIKVLQVPDSAHTIHRSAEQQFVDALHQHLSAYNSV